MYLIAHLRVTFPTFNSINVHTQNVPEFFVPDSQFLDWMIPSSNDGGLETERVSLF